MAGTITDQLKRICRKMGGLDVSGTVTDLLAKIESLSVNNLSQITSATVPLTRIDGSPRQANDLWRDTTNSFSWVFSGAVWRSAELQFLQINGAATSAHNALPKSPLIATHAYIETYSVAQQSALTTANNASNYRNMNLLLRERASGIEALVATIQNFPLPVGQANRWDATVNTAYLLSTYSGLLYRNGALVGTEGAYSDFVPIITYRWQFA